MYPSGRVMRFKLHCTTERVTQYYAISLHEISLMTDIAWHENVYAVKGILPFRRHFVALIFSDDALTWYIWMFAVTVRNFKVRYPRCSINKLCLSVFRVWNSSGTIHSRCVFAKQNSQFSGRLVLKNILYFLQVIVSCVMPCNVIVGHRRFERTCRPWQRM
jgi:hypothetical protein